MLRVGGAQALEQPVERMHHLAHLARHTGEIDRRQVGARARAQRVLQPLERCKPARDAEAGGDARGNQQQRAGPGKAEHQTIDRLVALAQGLGDRDVEAARVVAAKQPDRADRLARVDEVAKQWAGGGRGRVTADRRIRDRDRCQAVAVLEDGQFGIAAEQASILVTYSKIDAVDGVGAQHGLNFGRDRQRQAVGCGMNMGGDGLREIEQIAVVGIAHHPVRAAVGDRARGDDQHHGRRSQRTEQLAAKANLHRWDAPSHARGGSRSRARCG